MGDDLNWKAKYGGLDVSEAKRLKALEDENAKLTRLLADAMLDAAALKGLLGKKMVGPAAKREAHLRTQFEMGASGGPRPSSARIARRLKVASAGRRGVADAPARPCTSAPSLCHSACMCGCPLGGKEFFELSGR